jgi:hypothetical protein
VDVKLRASKALLIAAMAVYRQGCSSPSEFGLPGGSIDGYAVVRDFIKTPICSHNGASTVVWNGTEVTPGSTIRTDADSRVWLTVNGNYSAISVGPSSEVEFTEMKKAGSSPTSARKTVLNLKKGAIFGKVRQVATDSELLVKTPNGVATITNADFYATIESPEGTAPFGSFRCISGFVSAVWNLGNQTLRVTLRDTECFDPRFRAWANLAVGDEFKSKVIEKEFQFAGPIIFSAEGFHTLAWDAVPVSIAQPFNGDGPPRLTSVPLPPVHR